MREKKEKERGGNAPGEHADISMVEAIPPLATSLPPFLYVLMYLIVRSLKLCCCLALHLLFCSSSFMVHAVSLVVFLFLYLSALLLLPFSLSISVRHFDCLRHKA